MKKQGFTLVEVIIALTIIGLLAAFIAPAVLDLIPDKNKAKVLKYNTLMNNTIIDLLNNDYEYNISAVNVTPLKQIPDFDDKLLAGIGMVGDYTNDGSSVIITNGSDNSKIVTIDTNPSNSSSTIYNDTNIELKDVDTFQFVIDEYGTITAVDALTKAYLKNSKKLNDRKNDFANAKEILKASSKTTD